MSKTIYSINGENFSTLEEFADEITTQLNLEVDWRGNLDAFNDILYGGFGTPINGFILIWKNSNLSRERLSYSETIKWLNKTLERCHPANAHSLRKRIDEAMQNKGETLFDTLIEIITHKDHSNIKLILE